MNKVHVVCLIFVLSLFFVSIQAIDFKSTMSSITPEIEKKIPYTVHAITDFHPTDLPLLLKDLQYITVSYYTFKGDVEVGELIVHNGIAYIIIAIFKELFALKFPIASMQLIDAFEGDITKSIKANNSYAYCRITPGTDQRSSHALGLAIDINPVQYPWVVIDSLAPEEGEKYLLARDHTVPGIITKDSLIYKIFIGRGFNWGGECFENCHDLGHFEMHFSEFGTVHNH